MLPCALLFPFPFWKTALFRSGLFLHSSAAALSLGLTCLCQILSQYVGRLKRWSWRYTDTLLQQQHDFPFFFLFPQEDKEKKKQNKTKQKSQTILRYIFFLTYMKTEEELHSPWDFPVLGDHGVSSTSQPTKSCQNGSALCVLFIALVINLSANKLYNPCWYPHRSKCSIPSFWKRKQ